MAHKRLFIPGPTEVRPENLAALARPQIGHRSDEFKQLYSRVTARLRSLLRTEGRVFLVTSSATGVWEAAVRNCVSRRLLCCMQGAFSDRWHTVAVAIGTPPGQLQVEWGRPITAEMVERELARGQYDAIAVVHNETSTGVINRLSEIAAVVRGHPDVLLLVDAVSSLGGTALDVDALGIDVCLAGLQKALALPPGLAVAAVSQRALDRASTVKDRGYYFDFLELLRHDEKSQTPTTPAIPQIQALDAQLEAILAEGPERRFERHALLAGIVQDWARRHFELFAAAGYESPTVTCVRNSRNISVAGLNDELARHGLVISNGYGKLKERTFRIAHMGDTQETELRELLGIIDRVLEL